MGILKLKNTITLMKNSPDGHSSRTEMAEERISELAYKSRGLIQSGIQSKKTEGSESLRALWDNIKCINACKMASQREREKEKGAEKTFEEII